MKHINVFHRIAAVLLCLCMLLPLAACGETKMYQKQVFAMDTVMTLTAYGNKGAKPGSMPRRASSPLWTRCSTPMLRRDDLRHQPCRGVQTSPSPVR